MNHAAQGQDITAKVKRAIHRSAEPVGLQAMNILGALLCAFIVGVTITEGFAGMFPRIPEPINNQMPPHKPETDGQISTLRSEHILLYVRGADRQRLTRTISHDVVAHGGITVRKTVDNSTRTFAVPQTYLKRIHLLSASSGIKPPPANYRRWAIAVYNYPHDQSITGPADTNLTIRLAVPLVGNAATKPLIKWTLIPSLIALVTVPAAFLSERITART